MGEYNPKLISERELLAQELRDLCSSMGLTKCMDDNYYRGGPEIWKMRHGQFVICVDTSIRRGEVARCSRDSLKVYAYQARADGTPVPGKGYRSTGQDAWNKWVNRVGTHEDILERTSNAIRGMKWFVENPAAHTGLLQEA